MKINFQTVKIYFQALKIVLFPVSRYFVWGIKMFCPPSVGFLNALERGGGHLCVWSYIYINEKRVRVVTHPFHFFQ